VTELTLNLVRLSVFFAPDQGDDAAVKEFGVTYGIEMCKELFSHGVAGVHIYTLNLETSAKRILQGLALIEEPSRNALPWKKVCLCIALNT
jgi:methylenetetrahydrofolate reductase (NADPH)